MAELHSVFWWQQLLCYRKSAGQMISWTIIRSDLSGALFLLLVIPKSMVCSCSKFGMKAWPLGYLLWLTLASDNFNISLLAWWKHLSLLDIIQCREKVLEMRMEIRCNLPEGRTVFGCCKCSALVLCSLGLLLVKVGEGVISLWPAAGRGCFHSLKINFRIPRMSQ